MVFDLDTENRNSIADRTSFMNEEFIKLGRYLLAYRSRLRHDLTILHCYVVHHKSASQPYQLSTSQKE